MNGLYLFRFEREPWMVVLYERAALDRDGGRYSCGFHYFPSNNEQLYSLIVWSKPGPFSPWAKNHSQLELLVIFFPLGQKIILPFMIHIFLFDTIRI
jgi:hypothetical protein